MMLRGGIRVAYSMDQETLGLGLKTRVRRMSIYIPCAIDWSEADILVYVRSTYFIHGHGLQYRGTEYH